MSMSIAAIRKRYSTVTWHAQINQRLGALYDGPLPPEHPESSVAYKIHIEPNELSSMIDPHVAFLLTVFDTERKQFIGPTAEVVREQSLSTDVSVLVPQSRAAHVRMALEIVRISEDESEGWGHISLQVCSRTQMTILTQSPLALRSSDPAISKPLAHASCPLQVFVTITADSGVADLSLMVPPYVFVPRSRMPSHLNVVPALSNAVKEVHLADIHLELPPQIHNHVQSLGQGSHYVVWSYFHNGYGYHTTQHPVPTEGNWSTHMVSNPQTGIILILGIRQSVGSNVFVPVGWSGVFPFFNLYAEDANTGNVVRLSLSTSAVRVCGIEVAPASLMTGPIFKREYVYGITFKLDIPSLPSRRTSITPSPAVHTVGGGTSGAVEKNKSDGGAGGSGKPPKATKPNQLAAKIITDGEQQPTKAVVAADGNTGVPNPVASSSPYAAVGYPGDHGGEVSSKLDRIMKEMESLRSEFVELKASGVSPSLLNSIDPIVFMASQNNQTTSSRMSYNRVSEGLNASQQQQRKKHLVLNRLKESSLLQMTQSMMDPLKGSVIVGGNTPLSQNQAVQPYIGSSLLSMAGGPSGHSILQIRFNGISVPKSGPRTCLPKGLRIQFSYATHDVEMRHLLLEAMPPTAANDPYDTHRVTSPSTTVWCEPWPTQFRTDSAANLKSLRTQYYAASHVKSQGTIILNLCDDVSGAVWAVGTIDLGEFTRSSTGGSGSGFSETDVTLISHDGWVGYNVIQEGIAYLHVTLSATDGSELWHSVMSKPEAVDPADCTTRSSLLQTSRGILKNSSKVIVVPKLPVTKISSTITQQQEQQQPQGVTPAPPETLHDRRVQWAKQNVIVSIPRVSKKSKQPETSSPSALQSPVAVTAVDPALLEQRIQEAKTLRESQKRDIISKKILSQYSAAVEIAPCFGRPEFFTLPFANPFDCELTFLFRILDPGCGCESNNDKVHQELFLVTNESHWKGKSTKSIPFQSLHANMVVLGPHEAAELPFQFLCTGQGHYGTSEKSVLTPREIVVRCETRDDVIKSYTVKVIPQPPAVDYTVNLSATLSEASEHYIQIDDFTVSLPYNEFYNDMLRDTAIRKKCKEMVIHVDGGHSVSGENKYAEAFFESHQQGTSSVNGAMKMSEVREYIVLHISPSSLNYSNLQQTGAPPTLRGTLLLYNDEGRGLWKTIKWNIALYRPILITPTATYGQTSLTRISMNGVGNGFRVVNCSPSENVQIEPLGEDGLNMEWLPLVNPPDTCCVCIATSVDRVIATWKAENKTAPTATHPPIVFRQGDALMAKDFTYINQDTAKRQCRIRLSVTPSIASVSSESAEVEPNAPWTVRLIASPSLSVGMHTFVMWVNAVVGRDEKTVECHEISFHVKKKKEV